MVCIPIVPGAHSPQDFVRDRKTVRNDRRVYFVLNDRLVTTVDAMVMNWAFPFGQHLFH